MKAWIFVSNSDVSKTPLTEWLSLNHPTSVLARSQVLEINTRTHLDTDNSPLPDEDH